MGSPCSSMGMLFKLSGVTGIAFSCHGYALQMSRICPSVVPDMPFSCHGYVLQRPRLWPVTDIDMPFSCHGPLVLRYVLRPVIGMPWNVMSMLFICRRFILSCHRYALQLSRNHPQAVTESPSSCHRLCPAVGRRLPFICHGHTLPLLRVCPLSVTGMPFGSQRYDIQLSQVRYTLQLL